MKKIRIISLCLVSAVVTQMSLVAAETGGVLDWLTVANRLRLEYDDNIYQRETDKVDSFKILNEINLGVTLDLEPTFITLRYRPSFAWWSDREPDDTDLHHDLDLVINHRFSPRAAIGIKNTFRIAEQPEEIDRGVTIREKDDYLYNVTDANLDLQVLPRTYVVIGGRYTILEYDRDDVAATDNYDIWAAGVTLRQKLSDFTTVMAEYRREEISYDLSKRGSDSDFYGVGIEHTASKSFVGTLRAGQQDKKFKDASLGDETEPYADATITYIHSPRTRLSLGGGYSMYEADVFPYVSQNRTIVFGSVAHDLTAKLSLYGTLSYQLSEYDADQALDAASVGGDEEISQAALRVAYRLDARNSLELNYQYIDVSSDLREDFDRNRVSLGWRLDL
ncbi:MAG TPA: outer membrane beta-barrel protein [Kiritimatiellia bacterium]|nr:outer membrane beta-barrel protein [Kiritimatiellia bacterium]HMO99215.1 outer membrane beta-barrel protein [Kiritimatiellia bacterium]